MIRILCPLACRRQYWLRGSYCFGSRWERTQPGETGCPPQLQAKQLQVQDRQHLGGAMGLQVETIGQDLVVRELAQGLSGCVRARCLRGYQLSVALVAGDDHQGSGLRLLITGLCDRDGNAKTLVHPSLLPP